MVKFYRNKMNYKIWSTDSITYYLAFITVIIIPIYHWFLPPFMILWGVIWMFEISTRTKDIQQITPYNKFLFILFIIFFAWQIIGMIYSSNPKEGWRNIELRLSLILFPLVLISPGNLIRGNNATLLRLFALSTFFYLVICFGYAFYRSLNFQNGILSFSAYSPVTTWNYFYSSELAIFQHPSYLSMYILFSVFIALESFFESLVEGKKHYFWLVISVILLVSIYFLSSKAGIFALIITLPFYLFQKSRIIGINKYIGLTIIFGSLILFLVFLTNPRVRDYLKLRSGKEWSEMTLKEGRITIWNTVNKIIKRNIVFGVGTGDIQSELNKEYIKTGNVKLAEGNFNAHNQYIEIMLENGLIGLLLFLSLFGVMIYISIKDANLIYLMFNIIVFVSFMFESMLNRLAGVSFFSLFSFMLLYAGSNKQNHQIKNNKSDF